MFYRRHPDNPPIQSRTDRQTANWFDIERRGLTQRSFYIGWVFDFARLERDAVFPYAIRKHYKG